MEAILLCCSLDFQKQQSLRIPTRASLSASPQAMPMLVSVRDSGLKTTQCSGALGKTGGEARLEIKAPHWRKSRYSSAPWPSQDVSGCIQTSQSKCWCAPCTQLWEDSIQVDRKRTGKRGRECEQSLHWESLFLLCFSQAACLHLVTSSALFLNTRFNWETSQWREIAVMSASYALSITSPLPCKELLV